MVQEDVRWEKHNPFCLAFQSTPQPLQSIALWKPSSSEQSMLQKPTTTTKGNSSRTSNREQRIRGWQRWGRDAWCVPGKTSDQSRFNRCRARREEHGLTYRESQADADHFQPISLGRRWREVLIALKSTVPRGNLSPNQSGAERSEHSVLEQKETEAVLSL